MRSSLDVGEGETLFVEASPAHRALAVGVAAAAYRAGAAFVHVDYSDPRVRAARLRHGSDEALGPLTPWAVAIRRAHLRPESATVTILAEADPGVFDGIPPERLKEDTARPLERLGWYRRGRREGRHRWSGVAWPTEHWAGQVYLDVPEERRVRALADDLLWFCRVGPDDPVDGSGWLAHVDALSERARRLSELGLERLELRGAGTDLTVALPADARWLGGRRPTAYGKLIAGNIPTEENFTSPEPRSTNGTFRCSRPLSYQGRVIEGIAGEFRGGRLVRLEAATDEDRDLLVAFLDLDRNARRLGEVALVDSASRIGQTGRVYSNTLIDENAVAHIAFGNGFTGTRQAPEGERPTRVNRSMLHLDVMIGTDELEATGVARGGERVPLIRDGTWQI